MKRARTLPAALSIAATLGLAAAAIPASAQTARCCMGDCDMKPVGQVDEVLADTVALYSCEGDLIRDMTASEIMGRPVLEIPSTGNLFLPEFGGFVDSFDVTPNYDTGKGPDCSVMADLGQSGEGAVGMGAGNCN